MKGPAYFSEYTKLCNTTLWSAETAMESGKIGFQVGVEGIEVALGDVNELIAYLDGVVTVDRLNLTQRHNVGTMHPHKVGSRKNVFHGLHSEMCHQWSFLPFEVEHHIVFQARDIEYLTDADLLQLPIYPQEDGISAPLIDYLILDRRSEFKPLACFLCSR